MTVLKIVSSNATRSTAHVAVLCQGKRVHKLGTLHHPGLPPLMLINGHSLSVSQFFLVSFKYIISLLRLQDTPHRSGVVYARFAHNVQINPRYLRAHGLLNSSSGS